MKSKSKDKIYLRMAGGLGNQLFQLAAASLLARKNRCNVIPLFQGLVLYNQKRKPDALCLIKKSNEWLTIESPPHGVIQMLSVSCRAGRWLPGFGIDDKNFWEKYGGNSLPLISFMDGYFQYGWSSNALQVALGSLNLNPASENAKRRVSSNDVVMHIRGGDFIQNKRYAVATDKYYEKAIGAAVEMGKSSFIILSDDQNYGRMMASKFKGSFKNYDFNFLNKSHGAIEDFDILRSASARIIGNSTFAWWAAASAIDGITWSPAKFTVDRVRDFFLPNEIVIKV